MSESNDLSADVPDEVVLIMDPVNAPPNAGAQGLLGIGARAWPVITLLALNDLVGLALPGHARSRVVKTSASRPLGS